MGMVDFQVHLAMFLAAHVEVGTDGLVVRARLLGEPLFQESVGVSSPVPLRPELYRMIGEHAVYRLVDEVARRVKQHLEEHARQVAVVPDGGETPQA